MDEHGADAGRWLTERVAPGALVAMAGAVALFGGVTLWGVAFPLAELPASVGRICDALLTLVTTVQNAVPFSLERLSGMAAFLERLSSGDLAALVTVAAMGHMALTLAALACGAFAAWRGPRSLALAGAILVVVDVAAVAAACSYANRLLYLALHSLAEGNPWAVGRGVAGLPAEFAPTLGLWAALALAATAVALAVWGRRRRNA